MYVVISDTLSFLLIYGCVFGIQSSQVICKYSLPGNLFTTLCNSSLCLLIYEREFLPSNTNNPLSLLITFRKTSLN